MKLSSSLKQYLVILIICTILYIYIAQLFVKLDNEPEVHGWERHRSRNVSKYILPSKESALLKPKNLCQEQIFLRVFVVSNVRNFHRRTIIRETWGNEKRFGYQSFIKIHRQVKQGSYLNIIDEDNAWREPIRFKIVFLLGKDPSASEECQEAVRTEAEAYNDILQEDFIEHYHNLTLKSLFILKWASTRCLSNSSEFFILFSIFRG